MNYRIAEILAPEDLGAAGTKTIDIRVKDIISRIEISFRAVNVSAGMADHPAANILKVELVDGSTVLFALTGKEAQAVDYYDRGKPAGNSITRTAGVGLRAMIGMNFGRFLYDPLLALDPKKFLNPQLKISWDEDIANTTAVVNECFIHAHVFDEKAVTPAGFLVNKEHYSYTPSANGYEHIDLPTDHPYRKLLIQAQRPTEDVGVLLSEFRLDEDNEKRIPFDSTWTEEFNRSVREYGPYIEWVHTVAPTAGAFIYVTPTVQLQLIGGLDTAGLVFTGWTQDGGKALISAETADHVARFQAIGFLPHAVLCFPFGNQQDTADWYDVTKIGTLRLRIKAGANAGASDTFRVIIQQLKKY